MTRRLTVVLFATAILSACGCAESGEDVAALLFPSAGGEGGRATVQGPGRNVPELADAFATPPGQGVGSARPAPDGEMVLVNVVNASNQGATVNLEFFLEPSSSNARVQSRVDGLAQVAPAGLVHRTTLQMRAGGVPVDVGPETANLVRVRGELANGTVLNETLYRFGIDFDAATTLSYQVVDPTTSEPPPEQVIPPDLDLPPEPDDVAEDLPADDMEEDAPDEGDEPGGGGGGGGGDDGSIADCNGNGIPDATDIANLTSTDTNANAVPDECEIVPPMDDCFPISLDSMILVDEPVGAGIIDVPGGFDCYRFTAPAGARAGFEILSVGPSSVSQCVNPFIRWECLDAEGNFVFLPQAMQHFSPPLIRTLTLGGEYTLRVVADGGVVGTYSFEVSGLDNVIDDFAIAVGDVVSLDDPGPGAGNLETILSEDIYTFTGTAGQYVYFDALSFSPFTWRLNDPEDQNVFLSVLSANNDPGLRQLDLGGTYTIQVSGNQNGATGTYAFQLVSPPPPNQFALRIDQIVDNDSIDGAPVIGAGNLQTIAEMDVYTFTADPGQEVYFDGRQRSISGIRWGCTDANGTVVFSNLNTIEPFSDPGFRTLALGGEYTITVDHRTGGIGTYSFEVISVPQTDQTFDLAIGEVVQDGFINNVATAGAGFIENPLARDVYTFSVNQGSVIYFDALSIDNFNLQWQCLQPAFEAVVFPPQQFNPFNDPPALLGDDGRFTVINGGELEVTVFSDSGAGGAYSFQVVPAPPLPDPTQIALDTPVDVTVVNPGELYLYEFTAPDAGDVYFDIPVGFDLDLAWKCEPVGDGLPAFDYRFFNSGSEPGQRSLTPGEVYLITLYSDSGAPQFPHEFAVLDLTDPVDSFSISIPADVSDGNISGVEMPGAGNIENPGFMDTYVFTPNTDQYVYFQTQGASTGAVTWDCFGPDGAVFEPQAFFFPDPGLFHLVGGDEYTIEVENPSDFSAATYGFSILFPSVEEFAISIGDTVDVDIPMIGAGRLDAAFVASDVFTFTMAAPFADVVFEPLGVSTGNVQWKCVDPNGGFVFGPQSMQFNGTARRTLFTPGTYTLTVFNNGANEESYGFDVHLFNDECDGINCAFDGVIGFDNTHATSGDLSQCPVENDLWYEYVASCTGSLTVNTCGADFDTVLAVYEGCECPTENLVACNDDSCSVQSEVTVPVTAGTCFKIRVGGFEEGIEVGTGTLSISCFDPNGEE